MNPPIFNKRFLAFIDILGFSNIVHRMSKERSLFVTIRDVLKEIDIEAKRIKKLRRLIPKIGPGIIEAYKLEPKIAKYPRILVVDSVLNEVWNYHKNLFKDVLLKEDNDGCWYVNILTPPSFPFGDAPDETSDHASRFLRKIEESLIKELQRERGNLDHLSKIRWLVHKYNEEAVGRGFKTIEEIEVWGLKE